MSLLPKCAYWDTCYRKNPTHLAQFRHPADDQPNNADEPQTTPTPPKPSLKAVARVATVNSKISKAASVTKAAAAAAAASKATEAKEDVDMVDASADASSSTTAAKKPGLKRTREEQTASPVPTSTTTTTASKPTSSATNKTEKRAPSPATAAPSSPKPKPTSATATASSSSASTADPKFELKDSEWSDEVLNLWNTFHSGCWSTSCPVHSSPSSPDSFFELGSALLKALYDGFEFPSDLFFTLQFTAQQCKDINIGEYKSSKSSTTSDAASSTSSTSASTTPSGPLDLAQAAKCSWNAASRRLLLVFSSSLGIMLIGPFKILCGEFRLIDPKKVHPFLLDRFFYDSPEVWSVIQQLPSSSVTAASVDPDDHESGIHYAYYRDDPRSEFGPPAFVGRLSEQSPAITVVGPNLLAALMSIILEHIKSDQPPSKKKKLDPSQTTLSSSLTTSTTSSATATPETLRDELDAFARKYADLTLLVKGGKLAPPKRDSVWLKRDKKVVCDLDNKVGLVVPYVDDIGWRPVNCENHELTKIVKDIESAKYSGRKVNFDALDHLVTLTQYANDERDPGMGLELALNLMAKSKTNAINSDICRLLSLGYQLIDRHLYSTVIETHMRHRTKHIIQPPPPKSADLTQP